MMADSAFVRFKVNYNQAKRLAVGKAVRSDAISVGGHVWRVSCYPRGYTRKVEGWLSLYLDLMDRASSVKAIFEAFLVDGDGQPSTDVAQWRTDVRLFEGDGSSKRHGRSRFVTHDYLEKYFVAGGHITFVCGILIVDAHPSPMSPVPPPDIGTHLAMLLESSDGWDVAFCVQGETFRAHQAILAARSPVFREELELLGSKAQATVVVSSPPIALHEIAPATFGALLRFIYTDALPGDDDLGGSPSVTLQCLLAAADRYALYRLKLFCAHRLWNYVTVDTAADTLACALMYECPELKNKCIDFFAAEENFKKAVLTEGFMHLGQKFPSIITELREKVGA